MLEGSKLRFDEMQFAYQAKASTTMCTWTVTSVVDHFLRGGLPVFGAAIDMSKAVDMTHKYTEWVNLEVGASIIRVFHSEGRPTS